MIKQTAGRDALTGFADEFAHLNDDILFGEVSRESAFSQDEVDTDSHCAGVERTDRLLFPVSYADSKEERSDEI